MEPCLEKTGVERTKTAQTLDMDALVHIEYVYENFGFIPKWLHVRAY